jgi:hypothetical protein
MRFLFIAAALLLLAACKSKPGNHKKFNEKWLSGNWVVAGYGPSDKAGNYIEVKRAANDSAGRDGYELLGIYNFNGKGGFQLDSGSHDVVTGTLRIDDTLMLLQPGGVYKAQQRYWSLIEAADTSLVVVTDWPGQSGYKMKYDLVKIKDDEKFNIGAVGWKKPLDSNATDAQLKERLKTQLQYYANYFRTMSGNGISAFAPGKVVLPVMLYSGALGLKQPEKCPNWTINMGGTQNAAKAFEMLRTCFKVKFDYPDRDNFVLEYAEVITHLAAQLK